ncbi:MAG: DUF2975 domain-containing protein [Lewinellaceae bacterium]|nr:DUF2975 domain-containing protein [Lewinellaceae bacterium]
MKTPKKNALLTALGYGMPVLTGAGVLFYLLNLISAWGIVAQGPIVRGWVRILDGSAPVNSQATGSFSMLQNGSRGFFSMPVSDLGGLFQFKILVYYLLCNGAAILFLFGLYQLTLLVRSLQAGYPFQADNRKRVRLLAICWLLFPLLAFFAESMVTRIAAAHAALEGARYAPLHNNMGLAIAIAGLFMLAATEIFQQGFQLQVEHELTV